MKRIWVFAWASVFCVLVPIHSIAINPAATPAPAPIVPIAHSYALAPILRRIAACESTGNADGVPRQFNTDGSPLWGIDPANGKVIKRDVGEFQINTWVHKSEIESLDLDVVNSQADNIKFAQFLYQKSGTAAWNASKKCWEVN